MKKLAPLVVSAALVVVLASGVAWAATVDCPNDFTAVCYGTPESDEMRGTPGQDYIHSGSGDDTIHTFASKDAVAADRDPDNNEAEPAGDDTIFGGNGADLLHGQGGNDEIHGEDHDDRDLLGGDGADLIYGGPGDDKLAGQSGDDEMYGQTDSDLLKAIGGSDDAYGGDGADTLIGRRSLLDGGKGDDSIRDQRPEEPGTVVPGGEILGSFGNDLVRMENPGTVDAGPGDDDVDRPYPRPNGDPRYTHAQFGSGPRTITGGPGNDSAWLMGYHDDTVRFDDGQRDVVVSCGPGADAVYFDQGLDTFKSNPDCEQRFPR